MGTTGGDFFSSSPDRQKVGQQEGGVFGCKCIFLSNWSPLKLLQRSSSNSLGNQQTSDGKSATKHRRTSQHAGSSHPRLRAFQGAPLSIQEFYTFQWPLQLQRIKFSSLSVICQLICRKGSFCMNSTQKPAFPLAKNLPMVFQPGKLQVQLLNYCSFQWNVSCRAKKQVRLECNHEQDLHVEKIATIKREKGTRGGERETASQVFGNYFRLPYLLNLNNSSLSQRAGKHVLLIQRGERQTAQDKITYKRKNITSIPSSQTLQHIWETLSLSSMSTTMLFFSFVFLNW